VNQKVLFITLSLIFIGVGFTLLAQQARIDDLQDQLTNIQLIPGPQGEQGPAGMNGTQGPRGEPGVATGSGMCLNCNCPYGQYVTGFDAKGGLICAGSISSSTRVSPSGTQDTSSDSFIISYETQVTPSATRVISCDTILDEAEDMYICSIECPSGIVQISTIWINGPPNKYTNADTIDYYTEEEIPNKLTCSSGAPASCGATCA
jgi:hypothetical protein